MAKPIGKRPENFWKTLRTLLHYMGNHRFLLLAVAVLVSLSALANLLGTYMLKPIVNDYIIPRDVNGLIHAVALTACIYGAGVLSAYGYTQIMVVVAQKIVCEIREDLFHRMQSLPLRYFDTNPNGDTMSRFTNDVDTISDALNNSFAMMVQSFIQIVGTLTLIFILNWQLSLIVLLCYILMFAYIRFSGQRSRHYFGQQQRCLGRLNGFVEEMIQGQKVVKVFNHEQANMAEFRAQRRAAAGGDQRAGLCRHDGADGGQPLLCQLCDRGHRRRHHGHQRLDRRGLAGQLSGLCPADRDADQSVHEPVQPDPDGHERRRAHLRADGAGAGTRRRQGHADQRGAPQRWLLV